MNKISKLILAGALVLGIGWGGEEAPAAPAAAAPAAPAAAAPAAAAPAAAAPAAAGGGGVCARAADCCTGYIEAMTALSPATALKHEDRRLEVTVNDVHEVVIVRY